MASMHENIWLGPAGDPTVTMVSDLLMNKRVTICLSPVSSIFGWSGLKTVYSYVTDFMIVIKEPPLTNHMHTILSAMSQNWW